MIEITAWLIHFSLITVRAGQYEAKQICEYERKYKERKART